MLTAEIALCHALSPIAPISALPPQLQQAVDKGLLVQPRPNIYVLGTVHIGSESAKEVSLLLDAVRPQTVVVEVSPSRVQLIRRRNKSKVKGVKQGRWLQDTSSNQLQVAFASLPALAQRGWSTGGLGGLVFSTTIIWGSLLRRSLTANEEAVVLPRTDEFAAAIEAADAIGATVVASDIEIDQLMGAVARSMTPRDWVSLGINIAKETVGLHEVDPVHRRRNESLIDWEERRRNRATARASKKHGDQTAPCLSRALVDDRDDRFAESCLRILQLSEDVIYEAAEGKGGGNIIVCVVGLVHLDGVIQRLKN